MRRAIVLFLAAMLVGTLPGAAAARSEVSSGGGRDVAAAPPGGYARHDRFIEAEELGVIAPGAIAWDAAAGLLVIQDRAGARARLVEPVGRVVGSRQVVPAPAEARLTAPDPRTGHVFTLDPVAGLLVETDSAGAVVGTRTLDGVELVTVQGITFAPSGDPTDPPEQTSLYIADAGRTVEGEVTGAGVHEISLTEPVLATSLTSAAEATGTLRQTIATSAWNPASPDPSGLGYVTHLDRIASSDGEVDETTGAGFHGVNVWLAQRAGGAASGALNTVNASPKNNEPVGAAYDPARQELYLAKDGSSSRVWVYRLQSGTFVQVRYFTIYQYGVADAEGLAFGNNTLYVADGTGKEVWRIAAGGDAVVGTADDGVTHFDTASLGLSDPEGIGFHPGSGNLWIASKNAPEGILEVTTGGVPITHVSYGFAADNPGGLTLAPSSADASVMSVWVADRGVDNGSNPNENDGRIYEIAVGAAPPPPPPPPPPSPGASVLVNGGFEEASAGGAPTGWSTHAAFTRSDAAVHGGAYAGRHQSSGDVGYQIRQDAPVVAGQTYDFSSWINVPATTDAFKLVIKVQWRSSKKISVATIGKVTRPTNGWTALDGRVTAPAGATTARVMMVVSSLNATIYVDDLSLAAGP